MILILIKFKEYRDTDVDTFEILEPYTNFNLCNYNPFIYDKCRKRRFLLTTAELTEALFVLEQF